MSFKHNNLQRKPAIDSTLLPQLRGNAKKARKFWKGKTGKSRRKNKKVQQKKIDWVCTICTFLNHGGRSFCEMCNTKRQLKLADETAKTEHLSTKQKNKHSGSSGNQAQANDNKTRLLYPETYAEFVFGRSLEMPKLSEIRQNEYKQKLNELHTLEIEDSSINQRFKMDKLPCNLSAKPLVLFRDVNWAANKCQINSISKDLITKDTSKAVDSTQDTNTTSTRNIEGKTLPTLQPKKCLVNSKSSRKNNNNEEPDWRCPRCGIAEISAMTMGDFCKPCTAEIELLGELTQTFGNSWQSLAKKYEDELNPHVVSIKKTQFDKDIDLIVEEITKKHKDLELDKEDEIDNVDAGKVLTSRKSKNLYHHHASIPWKCQTCDMTVPMELAPEKHQCSLCSSNAKLKFNSRPSGDSSVVWKCFRCGLTLPINIAPKQSKCAMCLLRTPKIQSCHLETTKIPWEMKKTDEENKKNKDKEEKDKEEKEETKIEHEFTKVEMIEDLPKAAIDFRANIDTKSKTKNSSITVCVPRGVKLDAIFSPIVPTFSTDPFDAVAIKNCKQNTVTFGHDRIGAVIAKFEEREVEKSIEKIDTVEPIKAVKTETESFEEKFADIEAQMARIKIGFEADLGIQSIQNKEVPLPVKETEVPLPSYGYLQNHGITIGMQLLYIGKHNISEMPFNEITMLLSNRINKERELTFGNPINSGSSTVKKIKVTKSIDRNMPGIGDVIVVKLYNGESTGISLKPTVDKKGAIVSIARKGPLKKAGVKKGYIIIAIDRTLVFRRPFEDIQIFLRSRRNKPLRYLSFRRALNSPIVNANLSQTCLNEV